MQMATKNGLRNSISSMEDADFKGSDVQVGSRCTIKCIHNAAPVHHAATTSKGLVDMVATTAPEGMHGILKKPDVNVTNAKDKETILPKIRNIDEDLIQGFTNGFKKLQSPQSPSQPKSEKPAKKAQVAPSDSTSDVTAFNDQ